VWASPPTRKRNRKLKTKFAWPELKGDQKKYFDTKRVKDLYGSKLVLKALGMKLGSDVSRAAQQAQVGDQGQKV